MARRSRFVRALKMMNSSSLHTSAYVSIRQHTSAFCEGAEDDELVQPVEEFGAELATHLIHDPLPHFRLSIGGILDIEDVLRADIGGEDNDGVFEVNRAPLAVCDSPIIKHLQQDIQDIRMRCQHFFIFLFFIFPYFLSRVSVF
jgi:hypothetical protein